MSLHLRTPVSEAKGIGPAYARLLENRGMRTVGDLLLHFPVSYLDTSAVAAVIRLDAPRLYRVKPVRMRLSRFFPKRLTLVKVEGEIGSKAVQLIFFNKPYMMQSLKGQESILVFGRFERKSGILQMVNPLCIPPGFANRILPVYSPIASLKSGHLRQIMTGIFDQLHGSEDPLPAAVSRKHALPDPLSALLSIHLPEELPVDDGASMKKRFVYTEFFLYHLEIETVRRHFTQRRRLHGYRFHAGLRAAVERSLPFSLTPCQVQVFEEIVNDLRSPYTMTRLLQGEVASGKTVIAFLALLIAVHNGFQGAFLAPTEILAGQHMANARGFFSEIPLALLTGSTPAPERRDILNQLESGKIGIVFGTHALLQEQIRFCNLSMVVIDEQHRFGVAQRAAIFCKGKAVDLLVTTATPIPRTLQLSLYRDMAVSVLKKEAHRTAPVSTKTIPAARRNAFYRWLEDKIRKGEKGYIVLPLIEESEFFSDLRSLEEEKPFFQRMLRGVRWGVLTGRKASEEKQATLRSLKNGEIQVLLSTTVIEVGIDVPDATFIVIENADRYGLAQLHQMRGRVGRGNRPSACFLIASTHPSENGRKRLETLVKTTDGFRIAELDLQMRGGGRIAGFEQCGTMEFRIGDPSEDLDLFRAAAADAREYLDKSETHTREMREVLAQTENKLKSLSFS